MKKAVVISQFGWHPRFGGSPHYGAQVHHADAVGRPIAPRPGGRFSIVRTVWFDTCEVPPSDALEAAVAWAEGQGLPVWYAPDAALAALMPHGGEEAAELARMNRGFRFADGPGDAVRDGAW